MSGKKVFVVTGAYRGIGLEVVRLLCRQVGAQGAVYLTARDHGRASAAIEELRKEGLSPHFGELDIANTDSIAKFKQQLKAEQGHLDVLVNNAAIAYKSASTAPFPEQVENTMAVNYTGTMNLTKSMLDLMPEGSRIIHVASQVGKLTQVSGELQSKFSDAPNLEAVDELIAKFVEASKTDSHKGLGYSNSGYGMSKLGVIAVTKVMAKQLAPKVFSVAMCPGWCRGDMAGDKAPRSAAEGADTAAWLATLSDAEIAQCNGKFFYDRKEMDWSLERYSWQT